MTQEKLFGQNVVHSKLNDKCAGTRSSGETPNASDDGSQSTDSTDTIYDESSCKTYIIGKYLGKGAHARVYEGIDRNQPNQQYALKFMTIDLSNAKSIKPKSGLKEVKLNQVMREVDIHSMMQHVNIVRLESFFHQETTFCIVMEHCEANNLAHFLESIGKIGESSSRNFIKQLLDGLEYIHGLGIIHRDLKPANIYLTREMVIKIGDFGLADRIGSGRKGICGTPNYISPEALMEQGYTPAVDIWALGCIAYHMLAGKPPFDAASHAATYQLIRAHKYSPLSTTQAGAGARQLIHWMLSFLPEKRPSIPSIRAHVWMKRQQRKREKPMTWSQRRARRSAPIAQKLNEVSTTITSKSSDNTLQDLEYMRLPDKNSDCSVKVGIEEDSSYQSFWRNLLEKVRLKKSPSFHFLPATLLNLRSKVSQTSKITFKEDNWKDLIEELLKVTPSNQDEGTDVRARDIPVFVAKWIDYSNKFGFGYQMTDGSCGVLFNDKTQICLDGKQISVTYCTVDERTAFPQHSVPSFLAAKHRLLENFKEYMETQLSCSTPRHASKSLPTILSYWARKEKAILFSKKHFLQMNFFDDHQKIVFYKNSNVTSSTCDIFSIDSRKNMKKYDTSQLKVTGCPEHLAKYLMYVHSIL